MHNANHASDATPSAAEIFPLRRLAEQHPDLLPEGHLRWAARNRTRNGLSEAGAVFESPCGELLFHEPSTIAWLLGLSGRAKPRAVKPVRKPQRKAVVAQISNFLYMPTRAKNAAAEGEFGAAIDDKITEDQPLGHLEHTTHSRDWACLPFH
jgi:hypothetical protein